MPAREEEKDILEETMGSMKKFQILTVISCYCFEILIAWHLLAHAVMVPEITIYCANTTQSIKDSMSVEELNLLLEEACSPACPEVIVYTEYYDNTIVHQYKLYCHGRSTFTTMAQTILMLGAFVGNFIFGFIGSKFGRKYSLIFACLAQPFVGFAVAFSPNVYCFFVMKFILSVFVGGTMANSFVLYSEIVGVKWRAIVGIMTQIPFALGHLMLALFAYLHRDWRWFQLNITLPQLLLVHYIWTLPESPRWLLATGKIEKGIKQIEFIARKNKLPTEHIREKILADVEKKKARVELKEGKCTDLFKTFYMSVITVAQWTNWFTVICTYYGVAQYVASIGSNLYVSFALAALIQQPSVWTLFYTLNFWGRKWSLLFSNSLATVSLVCLLFTPADYKMIPAILTVYALGMSYPTLFVFSNELFPTVVRATGLGCAAAFGSFGAMLSIVFADLRTVKEWLPPVIFLSLMTLASFGVMFLPETKNCILPDTVEDVKRIMGENIFTRRRKSKEESAN